MTSATSVTSVDPSSLNWAADDGGVAAEVRRVVAAATAADGRSPLNEATLLSLRHHGLAGSTLFVSHRHRHDKRDAGVTFDAPTTGSEGAVTGFALVTGTPDEAEVNLVVHPASRGNGAGTALAKAVLASISGTASGTIAGRCETGRVRQVSAWSHGNHPAAAALASTFGFTRARDLWVMRRSLSEQLPPLREIEHVDVRPFRPGEDDDAFLAVNAEAFAHHPEQGTMTAADLAERMAEPWFDPAGFFLAVTTKPSLTETATPSIETASPSIEPAAPVIEPVEILGFHWTKVHPADGGGGHTGDAAFGEVYVVGVSPTAQGLGLGKMLTLTGLHHLRDLREPRLAEVILYVESDNAPAVAVYERLGFTHADADTDVMYVRGRA